jgi:hypothetical protein
LTNSQTQTEVICPNCGVTIGNRTGDAGREICPSCGTKIVWVSDTGESQIVSNVGMCIGTGDRAVTLTFKAIMEAYNYALLSRDPYHSYHEGIAVLVEELEELWDEIKKQQPDREAIYQEAIDVAAVITKFIVTLCTEEVLADGSTR